MASPPTVDLDNDISDDAMDRLEEELERAVIVDKTDEPYPRKSVLLYLTASEA